MAQEHGIPDSPVLIHENDSAYTFHMLLSWVDKWFHRCRDSDQEWATTPKDWSMLAKLQFSGDVYSARSHFLAGNMTNGGRLLRRPFIILEREISSSRTQVAFDIIALKGFLTNMDMANVGALFLSHGRKLAERSAKTFYLFPLFDALLPSLQLSRHDARSVFDSLLGFILATIQRLRGSDDYTPWAAFEVVMTNDPETVPDRVTQEILPARQPNLEDLAKRRGPSDAEVFYWEANLLNLKSHCYKNHVPEIVTHGEALLERMRPKPGPQHYDPQIWTKDRRNALATCCHVLFKSYQQPGNFENAARVSVFIADMAAEMWLLSEHAAVWVTDRLMFYECEVRRAGTMDVAEHIHNRRTTLTMYSRLEQKF